MLKLTSILRKLPMPAVFALGLVMVGLLAVLDYASGSELDVSLFYLLPIALVTRLSGKLSAIILSIIAAGASFLVNALFRVDLANPIILVWNAALLLGFYVVVTLTLAALEDSRRRQDDLTALIVHDLRSPLSISAMSLDMFDEMSADGMDATQRELIAVCKMSYNRMINLVNAILDLARLEAGEMPLEPANVSVRQMVDDSINSLAIEARQLDVSLVSEISPDLQTVYADQMVTERILINLLGNALKYSPKESSVVVSVTPGQPGEAVFSVRDKGRGIPAEWQGKVFDPYAQVDGQRRSGSGLGLSFCRRAAAAQGGRIWLESEPGKGTNISFTLPLTG